MQLALCGGGGCILLFCSGDLRMINLLLLSDSFVARRESGPAEEKQQFAWSIKGIQKAVLWGRDAFPLSILCHASLPNMS